MTPPGFLEFISRHGSQLLSLHLHPARLPNLEPFPHSWEDTLPRLRCLSVDFIADELRIPPLNHPLRHLVQSKIMLEDLSCNDILQFPNLATFTMPFHIKALIRSEGPPYQLVQDLIKDCQKRNIRVFSQFGHEVHSLLHSLDELDELDMLCERLASL